MESLQGHALVASPYLTDPNFLRSVVYLLRHDEEGAIGLILNRPMQNTIGELLAQLTGQELDNPRPVYYGGPVDGPLMLLQACEHETTPSIYIASDQQKILEICGAKTDPCADQAGLTPIDELDGNAAAEDESTAPPTAGDYRVFDGYAGWAAGQLEDELHSGGWLVWEIPAELLFANPENLWKDAVRQIGREILSGGIDPSKMPEDPAYN